jgi:hypothetical protein
MDQVPTARSRVHEVLSVPELLSIVFSFLEKGDVFDCATVCKLWSSIALDELWREMNDAPNLFSLLGSYSNDNEERYLVRRQSYSPANANREIYQNLVGDPEPDDWRTFEPYARRVRTFIYHEYDETDKNESRFGAGYTLSDRAWDSISRTRTTLYILPNLQHLEWIKGRKGEWEDHQLPACAMLLHPGVKTLVVAVPHTDAEACPSLYKNIAGRSPNLHVLDFRTNHQLRWDDEHTEGEFVECIRSLKKLRKLVVSAFWLTTGVVEALAELPLLRVVQYELFFPDRRGKPEDVLKFTPQLKEGAFPALVDLSIAASTSDTISFFSSPHRPASLQELFLHSPNKLPTVVDVIELLLGVWECLPRLTKLYLEFRVDREDASHDVITPESFVELGRTIRRFTRLEVLEIYWQYPLLFTTSDLDDIAASLPSIRRLVLNPEPFADSGGRPTSLRAIRDVARCNPKICELGLHLAVDLADLDGSSGEDTAAFKHAIELHVGSSKIAPGQVAAVAMWLSEVCPAGCRIMSGYSWTPSAIAPDWDPACEQLWARVDEMIALVSKIFASGARVRLTSALCLQLTRVRREERARRAELEREVEDLRTRSSLLLEAASLRISGVPI